jgi:hypothetical protein
MAEYQGKKVTLNKITRDSGGSKKFKVYTKNEKGNVVVVRFGDPNMEIRRDDPKARKNFRARHNCDNPGPKWKARYWSCKQWRKGTNVKGNEEEYEVIYMTPEEFINIPEIIEDDEPCCDECGGGKIEASKPGLWENIRRKKERMGKDYRPAKPGNPNRPSQEELDLAKGLQRGKPPKNDPRKTPAPKKDQKKGSKVNKPGSAKNPSGKITFSKETTAKLSKILKEHNAKKKGSKATLGMLKAVYRRGAGAYSTSHHPKMSRDGWAMARVRAFVYLLRNGRPSNPNYVQDNDLLPKSHPKKSSGGFDEFTKREIFVGKDKKNKKYSRKAFLLLAEEFNPFKGPQKPTDGDPKKKKSKEGS